MRHLLSQPSRYPIHDTTAGTISISMTSYDQSARQSVALGDAHNRLSVTLADNDVAIALADGNDSGVPPLLFSGRRRLPASANVHHASPSFRSLLPSSLLLPSAGRSFGDMSRNAAPFPLARSRTSATQAASDRLDAAPARRMDGRDQPRQQHASSRSSSSIGNSRRESESAVQHCQSTQRGVRTARPDNR